MVMTITRTVVIWSGRSRQAAVAKVSEVGSRLGRVGTIGFGKAVDVLERKSGKEKKSISKLNTY